MLYVYNQTNYERCIESIDYFKNNVKVAYNWFILKIYNPIIPISTDTPTDIILKKIIIYCVLFDLLIFVILKRILKSQFMWYLKKNINYKHHSFYFKLFWKIRHHQPIMRLVFKKYELHSRIIVKKKKRTNLYLNFKTKQKVWCLWWKQINNSRLYLRWENKHRWSKKNILKLMCALVLSQIIWYLYCCYFVIFLNDSNRKLIFQIVNVFIIGDVGLILLYYTYVNILLIKATPKIGYIIFNKYTYRFKFIILQFILLQCLVLGSSIIRFIIYTLFI